MIEYLSGNITAWYVRIGERSFCVKDYVTTPAAELLKTCRPLMLAEEGDWEHIAALLLRLFDLPMRLERGHHNIPAVSIAGILS